MPCGWKFTCNVCSCALPASSLSVVRTHINDKRRPLPWLVVFIHACCVIYALQVYRLLYGPVILHLWIGFDSHLMGINSLSSRASEKFVQTELCCCCAFYGSVKVVESLYGSCVLHACGETRQYCSGRIHPFQNVVCL